MSEETKIFKRIKYMDNVVENMRTIRNFLKDDRSDYTMKCLIDDFNKTLETNIKEVLDFAKEKGVYVREYRDSAASEIFRRCFGFWIDNAHRTTSEGYSRDSFRIKIMAGMYTLQYWRKTSKPTKKGIVKCHDRIFGELKDGYPVIERYSSGSFKIQADQELLDLLKEIEEFHTELENWANNNE